ncbi:hypothetical protein SAMN05518672_1131 [Chitinophaga sp. CF118]|uniref:hypothetical protein n=1 Tax=Chitinophaga sp. CF118 TaxID=1884367 RepID=UPI0008F1BBD7|nr:hypothetical protein [Chitinophaga sp. CF118]SFE95331.1 hypothetical protein SAMN05518672_1131 [Chitinophaga sp. CF118]
MKKNSILFLSAVFITANLLFSGCDKPDPDCQPQLCQIVKLTNQDPLYGNYTADFEYDAKGTPLRINHIPTATGATNYLFRHDQQNRVTDAIGAYHNGNYGDLFEFWHRFKYDGRNRVIQDSSFYSGIIGDNPIKIPDVPILILVTTFQYDSHNRVISLNEVQEFGVRNQYFYYNNMGNLDSVVTKHGDDPQYVDVYGNYDNKVNFHLTNPLWQFMDRDYSLNNSLNATAFNKYGLPTHIASKGKDYLHPTFLTYLIGTLDIQYSCK